MPTLEEWVVALSTDRVVTVESSQQLLKDILARQQVADAKRKGKLPGRKATLTKAPGLQEQFSVRIQPIHLLHRLGVVTTPPVPNLTDICSTWAQYRYLWAFELPDDTPDDRLRLSEPAQRIDFHQKGLMSDQIGVGMAALLMELLYGAPDAIDVDVALDDPMWNISLREGSPDYIFQSANQQERFVVECKGTRCGRSVAVEQLRRGVEQVTSLVFSDGRPSPTALVVGTQITASGTRVFIVDPPAEPPSDASAEKRERVSERSWRIEDAKWFDERVTDVAGAKLLAFSVLDEPALKRVEAIAPRKRRREPVATPSPREIREDDSGDFVGSTFELKEVDGLRVEVFQGLETKLHRAYAFGERSEIREASESFKRDFERTKMIQERPSQQRTYRDGDETVLRSLSPDGSMLEFRLRHRLA